MKRSILLLAGLPLLGSCALSQGAAPMQPFNTGMKRSSLGVNQFETSTIETPGAADVDRDALRLNFTHGWFVTPELEVGGMLGYTDVETGAATSTTWTLDAYGRWYFDNRSRIRTWAQAYAGIGNVDLGTSDDDLTEFGLGIGLSDMISESTSFDLGLDYRMQSFDTSDVDDTGLFLTAFFSIFYGG
ncbi:MAG: hypothetical protein ACYTEP_12905 [Planctomycetota bacterium]